MSARPDPNSSDTPQPGAKDCPPDLETIARQTKYPADAFAFVEKGLGYTVTRMHGKFDPKAPPTNRHVTGPQLCAGLRDYAIEQYGLLAKVVLNRWRITRSDDFGQIVFAMVDAGRMSKTEDDSIRDFVDVFDFDEAFRTNVQIGDRT